jgi:hypothetical protein
VTFYFDFGTYLKMVRLARREPNRALRRRQFRMLFLLVPIAVTLHTVCFFLDRIFFPGLARVEVRTPVFIVGHARSGTTLFHRLMTQDGERFSYFRLYEMFFPSLVEKKLIRLVGRFDKRVLGGRIERAIREGEEKRLAATKDIHRTGLFEPEEDDFVLSSSCASGFWIVMFPYMGELDFYYVDEWPERKRRRLMSFYKECVKRQIYLNGNGRIHLSKNPVFSGRVQSLIDTFPDARIVVLVRNPNETIPSLLKLLKVNWNLGGWADEKVDRSLRIVADQSIHTYLYPFEVLSRNPHVPQAIVDYRELVTKPRQTVTDVYATLGFPVSDEMEAVLEKQESRGQGHETTHTYSLEEFGLTAEEIRKPLAGLFERFGWEREGAKP